MSKDIEYQDLKNKNAKKVHISFSEFSKYQGCGHKHLIEKYLKLTEDTTSIHLIFGNSIHKAIEAGIRDKVNQDGRIALFKEEFTSEMMNKLQDTEEYKELKNFLDQGENILRILNIEQLLVKYEIIGVELPLYEVLFDIYHFKGFIDLIVRDRVTGRYLIFDWKTSSESWDVSKKKKDRIFLAQMQFYKYFYARKYNIDINLIDCKYIVLNRLQSKKLPELGFGEIQPVEIFSDMKDIEESLTLLAETVSNIHIKNTFTKVKLDTGKSSACFFCPYKKDLSLCDSDPDQYKKMLNLEI